MPELSGYMPNDPNFSLGPNFINPGYATPEQAARIKALSELLLKQGGEPAKHWAEALGNIAQTLVGTLQGNRYDQMQQGGLAAAIAGQTDLERQRQMNIARQLSGGGAASPGSQPSQMAPGGAAALPDDNALKAAILMQESGNRSDSPMSYAGATGPGQIMPDTFRQFAQPGEDINNPDDNRKVSGRILDTYMKQYGDPARAAVAYYSGPGNVAPPGSPTPWIKDKADPRYGKTTSSYVAEVLRRMPQKVAQAAVPGEFSPQSFSAFQQNPWANPETKKFYQGQVAPAPYEDVYKRPGVITPMGGARASPVQGALQPGVMAPTSITAEGGVSTQTPVLPPGQGQGAPGLQGQIQPLVDVGKNVGQQAAVNKANREQQVTDVQSAYQAVPIRQTLRAMKDDILSHGDKMIFGPTADWINNLRKGIAQHAPGFLTESDISGLAAADSFEKLSTQLQSIVGRQVGGTDASLLQGIKSVPGTHNSKEGALALIDMLDQAAGLNSQFIAENQYKIGQPGFNYLGEKNAFFDKHPIINPISKNPIRIDIQKGGSTNSQIKVIGGKTYMKIDGVWHEGM